MGKCLYICSSSGCQTCVLHLLQVVGFYGITAQIVPKVPHWPDHPLGAAWIGPTHLPLQVLQQAPQSHLEHLAHIDMVAPPPHEPHTQLKRTDIFIRL